MKKLLAVLATGLLIAPTLAQTTTTGSFPYQNPALPVPQRVSDLIGRMTLPEKVSQLFSQAPAIDRLGVPAYNWWNECLHGVARAGKATVFPQAIGLAATFDQELMAQVGTAVSDEARAKHHHFLRNNVRSIYTGLTFWTPNINIFRDPRWGRGQETYGEDPYLTGRLAVNYIRGLQGDDPTYFKTVATAKHYAVHSGPEYSRHQDNVFVNDRDLYETYLPAFRATVQEANVQSVMCAYNRFRDQPCCGSNLLLNNILRNEFGFKGYVVSDCGAITDFYAKANHHVVDSPAQAWGWSVAAGTDLNCEEGRAFLENHLDSAVATGILNERDINTSLTRLFTARFRLGMFDPPAQVPYAQIPMSVVGSASHLALTQRAAERSLVLLKNDGTLPLRAGQKIALIGPNADNFTTLIGNYNGTPIRPSTPLAALRARVGAANVLYAPGCPLVPGVFTNHQTVPATSLFHDQNGRRVSGLRAEYFANLTFAGTPRLVRTDATIDFAWERSPLNPQLLEDQFSVRWSGLLVPPATGTYVFGGTVVTKIDGKLTDARGVRLEKGKAVKLEAERVLAPFWWGNAIEPEATLTWVETTRDYRAEALDAARRADVVVFCGGISANLEGEEMKLETDGFAHGDRTHLDLPSVQEELLRALHQTGKPVVYVNFSGSAVALNWADQNLPAIVQAFYPGEATGPALTRLLFGEFNPAGRLPVTFYKSVNDLPDFKDYRMAGRTYRYFAGTPLYGFGHGLSYTTFAYQNLRVPASAKAGTDVAVAVEVRNTGPRDGEEVVQLYASNLTASVPVPLRTLVGFKRVMIKAGQSVEVTFAVKAEQLSVINGAMEREATAGTFRFSAGGGQPTEAARQTGRATEATLRVE